MAHGYPDKCPHCAVEFAYVHDNGETYYKVIGIEDPRVYDGCSWWGCPECKHVWKRFSWSPDPALNSLVKTWKESRNGRRRSH
jgi:hypothetical protein